MGLFYNKFNFQEPAFLNEICPVSLLTETGQIAKLISHAYHTCARKLSGRYILSPGFTLKAS